MDNKKKEKNDSAISQDPESTEDFLRKLPLQESLIGIQLGLKAPKNQYNNFGEYKYRSCEDILEALKPLLLKHGCLLTISDEIGAIGEPPRWYVRATVTIAKNDQTLSVSAYARETEHKKKSDPAQLTGAASSYARKYALNGLFLIDDTKDPDATNNHGKGNGEKKEKEKPPADLKKMQTGEGRKWIATFDSPEKALERIQKTYSLDEVGEALITDIWHAEHEEASNENP